MEKRYSKILSLEDKIAYDEAKLKVRTLTMSAIFQPIEIV